ncbi:CBASS cGAMP synthase [Phaeobacter sp. JH20_02]|uniref:CBASS cGAMP synthase n=1 Tax=unclassified Phaeobacter TaxID=2621772 RepID=UPI003A8AB524
MPVNAHKALNSTNESCYVKKLKLPKEREDELRAVRDELRDAIRSGLKDWTDRFPITEMVTRDAIVALNSEQKDITEAFGRPKFRMQGSFSYSTVNDPAKGKTPPLQIDLDDGMFLPTRYINRDGALAPSVAADGYFRAVEQLVSDVCEKNGWTLKKKTSCIRVEIDREAHVDIALYAVPEKEFATLVETAMAQNRVIKDDFMDLRDDDFANEIYGRLSADQMRLACRGDDGRGNWIPSDPRKLEDWFRDAVRDHGDQVRFVSRYLKAWRDEQDLVGLASIALMWAVVEVFKNHQGYKPFNGRDDLALLAVARALPDILRQEIPNPVVPGERLDQGWSQTNRQIYASAAMDLEAQLDAALIRSSTPQATLRHMLDALGSRFPTDVNLLVDDAAQAGDTVAAPEILTNNLLETKDERPAVKLGGDERYA